MTEFATLYKQDKSGKIREWNVKALGNEVIVEHGAQGGAKQQKATIALPKNVGRANETTGAEQALAEATAKWTRQLEREGYCKLEDLGKESAYLMPMLALDATKVIHRVKWDEAVGSRKLDGVRCIWRPELQRLQSRKGTFYDAPQHVIDQLCGVTLPLDGELYVHGVPLNEILGAARKHRPLSEKLEFHAFDIAVPNMPFKDRHLQLTNLFYDGGLLAMPHISVVDCDPVTLDSHVDLHNKYVQAGYEGLMIRHLSSEYDFGGRSDGLFKYKVFKDDEFKIVGVHEDADGGAVLTMVTEAGDQFGSRPRGTLEYRRGLLDGKCVGHAATVRYFTMTSTENPVPQFPVVVAIGDEK